MNTEARPGRLVLFCALAVAGLGVVLLFTSLHRPEPVHDGKPLNYWLNQLLTTNHTQAEFVIQEFGTNIVPILQAKLKAEHSLLRNWYRKMWPAMPTVVQHLLRAPVPIEEAQEPIHRALCALGYSAVPYLVGWLQANDPNLRLRAIYAVGDIGPAASAAVPILAKLMDDPDPRTRNEAALALASVGTSTNGAIPALVQVVGRDAIAIKRRGNAAWALGRMGAAAKAGVPALNTLSNSTNSYARVQAEIALWRIDGDTNMIPRLVVELENAQDVASCDRILIALADTGAPGEAVPTIVKIIESPAEALPQFARSAPFARSNLVQHARQALSKIDPEALKRLR